MNCIRELEINLSKKGEAAIFNLSSFTYPIMWPHKQFNSTKVLRSLTARSSCQGVHGCCLTQHVCAMKHSLKVPAVDQQDQSQASPALCAAQASLETSVPGPLPQNSAALLLSVHLSLTDLRVPALYTQILLLLFVPYLLRNENVCQLPLQSILIVFFGCDCCGSYIHLSLLPEHRHMSDSICVSYSVFRLCLGTSTQTAPSFSLSHYAAMQIYWVHHVQLAHWVKGLPSCSPCLIVTGPDGAEAELFR